MHASQIRPETAPLDRRRLAAAGLSAVVPGLGQLFNGRVRLAALFLIPSLLVLLVALALWNTQSPARLVAWIVSPRILGTLLVLNVLLLAWRLVAVVQAFIDTRRHGPTGRLGVVGLVVIAILVALPHLAAYRYGTLLGDTFAKVFAGQTLDGGGPSGGPEPGSGDRINVLLIGVDKTAKRPVTLTDTMMVASLDPVGKTVSMVSIPRDLVDTPLPDGDVYGPKLNSLLTYADGHRDVFPQGGVRALQDAIGTLLGIPIHYYARLDFAGFMKMIDAVGGVDVTVPKAISDPGYDGYGFDGRGWSITAGEHHLDGPNALAYARSRKSAGESDFTRAARQQQILVALRDQVTSGGGLLFKVPDLLGAVGDAIRSDVPVDRLPDLAAVMSEVRRDNVTSVVIKAPLVHEKTTRFGDSLEPDLPAIRAMAAKLFPTPGVTPQPWPAMPSTKPSKAAPSARASAAS